MVNILQLVVMIINFKFSACLTANLLANDLVQAHHLLRIWIGVRIRKAFVLLMDRMSCCIIMSQLEPKTRVVLLHLKTRFGIQIVASLAGLFKAYGKLVKMVLILITVIDHTNRSLIKCNC
jgi:hypothetical protein